MKTLGFVFLDIFKTAAQHKGGGEESLHKGKTGECKNDCSA